MNLKVPVTSDAQRMRTRRSQPGGKDYDKAYNRAISRLKGMYRADFERLLREELGKLARGRA